MVHLVHLDDETLSKKEINFITLILRMSQRNENVGISNVIKFALHQR